MKTQPISRIKRKEHEKSVQSGLALTPSMMDSMAKQGIPVSSQNLQGIYDDNLGAGLPMEFQRGIDMADMWNARKDIQGKVRKLKNSIPKESKSE